MNIKEFDTLAKKYLEGNCTEKERLFVENWYKTNSDPADLFNNKREEEDVQNRIWKNLSINRISWIKISMAASILLMGLLFYLYEETIDKVEKSPKANIEVRNTSTKTQKVWLTDGSVVDLGPHSRLSYPENFAKNQRLVYLEGNAVFDVAKNPNKPFLVLTDKLTTEVLGTKFMVNTSNSSQDIEVAVLEGKVMVYDNSTKSNKTRVGAVLTANQKITFDKVAKVIQTGIVDKPIRVKEIDQSELVFEDNNLSMVLNNIKSTYKIDFIIENQMLENCLITADLNDLDMYHQLDIICKIIQAKYEIRGTSIYIYGPGCS